MKLTKKRALEITRDMWMWLAEHPDCGKEHWPKWKQNGGTIPRMTYNCACCAFTGITEVGEEGCNNCPLKSLWGNDCCAASSPYAQFEHGIAILKNALIIANAAAKELKLLARKKSHVD